MPKVKEAWRFRKRSEADPILILPCGCKKYCYTGQIVRFCDKHSITENCPNCNGSGMKLSKTAKIKGISVPSMYIPCFNCSGMGKINIGRNKLSTIL